MLSVGAGMLMGGAGMLMGGAGMLMGGAGLNASCGWASPVIRDALPRLKRVCLLGNKDYAQSNDG
jgi:hypothetical protein